jgi:ribonuclease HI
LTAVAVPGNLRAVPPERYRVFTDGGCRPNPGPGGWGAVVEGPEGRRELSGGEAVSTNNRMELTAAVRGLESLPAGSEVEVITDSTYVQQGITRWLAGWRRKGWVTAAKEPVKNRDLWQALDEAARRHRVRWSWTRGHAGQAGNERAHELAAAAIPAAPAGPRAAARAAGSPGAAASTSGAAAGAGMVPRAAGEGGAAAAPVATPAVDAVDVYLGVAWSATRKLGAWGAVLVWGEVDRQLSGRVRVPSANGAHIAGAVAALAAIRRPVPVHVVTVSDYLRDGATQWIAAWRLRGWRNREGDPVANREVWEALAREIARLEVTWEVPAGDALPPEIERARALARAALAGE